MDASRTPQRILIYKHLGLRNMGLLRGIREDSFGVLMAYGLTLKLMMMALQNSVKVPTFCL
jgi:hypothetical protein